MPLLLAAMFFSACVPDHDTRLRIMAGYVEQAAKRLFGIPDFKYYALADGLSGLFKRNPGPPITRVHDPGGSIQLPLFEFAPTWPLRGRILGNVLVALPIDYPSRPCYVDNRAGNSIEPEYLMEDATVDSKSFVTKLDGHSVVVDAARQEVRLLDGEGREVFRDRLQVAAGSFQGVFTPGKHLAELTKAGDPAQHG